MPDATNARPDLERARQLHAAGRLAEAVPIYERLLQENPRNADALHLLGVAHLQAGRHGEALALIDRALAARPAFPEAHNNRGNLLKALGRLDEAAAAYRAAISASPTYAAAHNHLGVLLFETGDPAGAARCYREALRLRPDFADALSNLGTALRDLGQLEEAVSSYEKALSLQPNRAETLSGMGLALNRLDRTEEALRYYDRALSVDSGHVDSHLSRALLLLSQGRFEEGWPEFEYRLHRDDFRVGSRASPRWKGEDLAGSTLHCLAEQGYGDSLQFVRFAAAAARRAGRVVVEAPTRLVPLLRPVAGIDVVAAGTRVDADFHVPLMSLLGALGISLSDLPVLTAYLSAEPARAQRWRERLPPAPLRVGLAWQGNPSAKVDRGRSLRLEALAPLLGLPDAAFVCLQAGHGREQIAGSAFARRLTDFGAELDADGAFLDTAAIIEGLDVVVTTDTSIAHLAGALGAPTFILLQKVPDWRWLRDRDDCPWYPSARLFRQEARGDWTTPVRRVAAALSLIMEEKGR